MSERTRRFVLDRRRFLKAAGLAGAGAMGCGLWLPRLAAAQAVDEAPRRIVFVLAEHGWVYDNLRMRPRGVPVDFGRRAGLWTPDPADMLLPDPDGFEIDLASTPVDEISVALSPLAHLRERLTVIDGLGLHSIGLDGLADAHTLGHAHALGSRSAGRNEVYWPTLDQRLAARLRAEVPRLTDLTSLEYSVVPSTEPGMRGFSSNYTFRYRDDGAGGVLPVPAETRVEGALNRLSPGAGGPRFAQLRAIQGDMLDALSFEYDRVGARVGGDDAVRLRVHRDLLRDLSARTAALQDNACAPPGLAPWSGDPATRYGDDAQGFIDLITMAFACDITRVASLRFVDPPVALFDAVGDLHGNYAHPSAPDYAMGRADAQHETAVRVMTRHMLWHAEQIARLAERLDAVPEGDGTLLDRTVIVWVNELSHGNHAHDQWPVVMLGGCGGRLRTGRYLRLPQTLPTVFGGARQFCGVPHTWLLGALATAMGMPMVFGDAGDRVEGVVADGPLAGQQGSVAINGVLDAVMRG